MIEGRVIVCLASSWEYDPTSKHQIMRILSRKNRIVWVDYHGTRRPTMSLADLKAAGSVLRRFAGGIRRVAPSIVRVTPLVVPGVVAPGLNRRHSRLGRLHQKLLIAQIRRAIRLARGSQDAPLQIWSFAPDVPYLVGRFGEECFLYYCVDEYSQFEGFDGQAVIRTENDLIDHADLVITTSQALFDSKSRRRPDVVLARHGVDYDHFASAWRSKPAIPSDIASIPGPIFGFFGLIHHWVDRELIARVAKHRPQYSFVLIGDAKVNVSKLRRLKNVYLLGRRPYEQLPAYCAAFDAGLLLFVPGAMTRNINPIKMVEYLAAGLPVVSTPLPEAERYRGPILLADNAERFANACDQVLAADYAGRREAISRVVEHESWTSKVEWLSQVVMNCVHPKTHAASKPASEVVAPAPPERNLANLIR